MSRNRRGKRKIEINQITDSIDLKTFLEVVAVLMVIIVVCIVTIVARNYRDRSLLAKQKEELEQSVEEIFAETIQSIADNGTSADNEQSNNDENKEVTNNEAQKEETIIRISAVGDILCNDELLQDGYQKDTKTYYFDNMFQNITGFISKSDAVIGTMETSFTNNQYSGYGNRNSPKEFGQAVKKSGINLVSITTNHSLDYGISGLKETKKYLQEIGFSTVGDRLEEQTVNIQEIKGTKIAFLSYTYGVENQNKKTKEELGSINIYDEKIAKEELEYANENADYTFVIMHWGDPYATEPSKEQKQIADFLIENGADVILGNHPAAIQPMEVRQNKEGENVFIAYSLGNYISSIDNEKSKVELVLNIELRKDEEGKIVLSKVDYTPLYVLDNGSSAKNRFELIDMKGVAKEYAGGNTKIVDKKTYNKLLDGLKLLEKVVKVNENEQ